MGHGYTDYEVGHDYTDVKVEHGYTDGNVGHGYTDGRSDMAILILSWDMAIFRERGICLY